MEFNLGERIKSAFNVFLRGEQRNWNRDIGMGYSYPQSRTRVRMSTERSLVNAIYNRIAVDCSAIQIQHISTDENHRYVDTVRSALNDRLTVSANLDQTGRAFLQDAVISLLDEGCVALVAVDIDVDDNGKVHIVEMRTGKVLEWYPENVKVRVYNQRTGEREDVILPKAQVAIVENPMYGVMNQPNSTLQRLIRKLNLLDAVDEQSGAGKLDIIIQVPYTIKSEARRNQALARRQELEQQLSGSKYGIAYADGTEKIVQLNRSLENNLLKQVEYLTSMLYSQLGMTQAILDGSASEQEMLNYFNRTIEPILTAIVDELNRKFISDEEREKGETIRLFRNPFKLVPVDKLAEISDKFTRNEIMTSNELRQEMGMKARSEPQADELRNSNIKQPLTTPNQEGSVNQKKEENQNE